MGKPVFVDVGGLGGLGPEWAGRADRIRPVMFEPNVEEAERLRPRIEGELNGAVVAGALGSSDAHHILNLTASAGCSSLLTPNDAVLRDYSIRVAFEVRRRAIVECTRYDALFAKGAVPEPDIVKIDVQGFEYDVLQGFGDLLGGVVAIEIEAHFQPLYIGQKLLHDYVELLGRHGLRLRKLQPVDHFDGYVVEVNAWFTAGPERVGTLSPDKADALRLAEEVWSLTPRRQIFHPDTFKE